MSLTPSSITDATSARSHSRRTVNRKTTGWLDVPAAMLQRVAAVGAGAGGQCPHSQHSVTAEEEADGEWGATSEADWVLMVLTFSSFTELGWMRCCFGLSSEEACVGAVDRLRARARSAAVGWRGCIARGGGGGAQ